MLMVRIRVYRGDRSPVGELDFPAASVQLWLSEIADHKSIQLHEIRDLVDPEHENEKYDWDIWAKPREVAEDLKGDGGDLELIGLH